MIVYSVDGSTRGRRTPVVGRNVPRFLIQIEIVFLQGGDFGAERGYRLVALLQLGFELGVALFEAVALRGDHGEDAGAAWGVAAACAEGG